jgi:NAD(P)-dependent dehydrogenase (short-subunit alcohol dehydrogenase family)
MRLKDKVAIIVGGGQTPGETIGNGRATAMLFAREGAKVLVVDRDLASAEETVANIADEGGTAAAAAADVTDEASLEKMIAGCTEKWGRIDILHNNVGFSLAGGDAVIEDITVEAFDRVTAVNLRGMVMTCKHVLPIMRAQKSGVILSISSMAVLDSYPYSISSMAVLDSYPYVTYKTSKAGVVAMTEQLAYMNADHGIRANVILPGLMNTPMAVESRITDEMSREDVIAARDAKVPLGKKMGSAWDVAYAALFLASDEAKFISGVTLPVDGGAAVRRG